MLEWMTAGESHGPALVATIEGVPQGIRLTTAVLRAALAAGGPVVVDCQISPDANVLPMIPPGGTVENILLEMEED